MGTSKITIRTTRGMVLIDLDEILYCKARGRYSTIVLTNGKEYLLTKVLKMLENVLPTDDFFRTHKSFLVNLNHVKQFHSNHKHPIILKNDVKIQLAKRRTHDFLKRINEFAPSV
jgi:two-component system LytT family response regulator